MIAGGFQSIELQEKYKNIPMRLYCRESLLPYLKKLSSPFFEITIKTMEFYEKFFGYPYPFAKYDHVFWYYFS